MSIKSELTRLKKLVPAWQRLAGPAGYQHNGQHLGRHTLEVIDQVNTDPEFKTLPPKYRKALILAAFFHDIGKPTGRPRQTVKRIFDHEAAGSRIAGTELARHNFPADTIRRVKLLIGNDRVMSEFGRDRLHRRKTAFPAPAELAGRLDRDRQLLKALLILNRADVVAAGLAGGKPHRWQKIWPFVNKYFSACLKEAG